MSDFEKWLEDQDFYTNMRFIHGDKLFDKDGDVYRVLPVHIAFESWFASACTSIDHIHRLQRERDQLKTQLNNMERCYIGKKKQVEAVSQVLCELKESLKDFQEMDLYDKGHRVTTEYVIADLEQALRGEHENTN